MCRKRQQKNHRAHLKQMVFMLALFTHLNESRLCFVKFSLILFYFFIENIFFGCSPPFFVKALKMDVILNVQIG